MGNCCQRCVRYRNRSAQFYRNVTLLMVGLDNAGKTTIAKRLNGDTSTNILPTVGFSSVIMNYRYYKVTIYDLGGAVQIRDIWKRYYDDVHGVIFVLDASSTNRIHEAERCFEDILSNPKISGKPVLVLGNKQDKEDALDEMDVIDNLKIERTVNRQQCPTRVEICSALDTIKTDVRLQNGYHWLMSMIIENYNVLNERVKNDMSERSLQVEREKAEWRKRKMERERLNDEDLSIGDEENCNKIGDSLIGLNPFKPIGRLIDVALRPSSSRKVGPEITNGVLYNRSGVRDNTNVSNANENEVKTNIPKNTDIDASACDHTNENGTIKKRKRKSLFSRHKNKLKFNRPNKTAPVTSQQEVRQNTSNTVNDITSLFTVSGKHVNERSTSSSLIIKEVIRIRPSTAPSRISTGPAWSLTQPLEVIDLESVSHYNTNRVENTASSSDSKNVINAFIVF